MNCIDCVIKKNKKRETLPKQVDNNIIQTCKLRRTEKGGKLNSQRCDELLC